MENASEALIMAGSVLLLIIALTVSISSLSTLKTQVDEIVMSKEQLEMVRDESDTTNTLTGGYLNFLRSTDNDVRTVGVETIISSVRRMRKEQFVIYICLKPDTIINNLPESIKITLNKEQKYKTDVNKEITIINTGQEVIRLALNDEGYKYIEDNSIIESLYKGLLNSDGTTKEFKEYIGVYQEKTEEGVSSANKQTYRIITFVEQ